MILLNGHRISLKYPAYEDYVHIYQTRFADEVVYWADDAPRLISRDEYARSRILSQDNGEIIERMITLDGEPIGTVTGRDFVPRTCQCTLGVVIAMPEYWGHGYGFHALKLFMRVLYSQGVSFVVLETFVNNKRAQRCFYKLGFQKKRVYWSAGSGRYVLQMVQRLLPPSPIGEVVRPGDARWKSPHSY